MNIESTIGLQKLLAPLHLIGASLIVGVAVFAGVALTMGPIGSTAGTFGPSGLAGSSGAATAPDVAGGLSMPMLMRIIWGVLAMTQIPLALVFRRAFINRAAAVRRGDPQPTSRTRNLVGDEAGVHVPTFNSFRNATIIGLALVESLALLGCIAILFSADAIDLLLVGVPLLIMLALFPTTGRWRTFDRTVQERMASGR